MKETTAYIGLGSNLGERESFIKKALVMLDEASGVTVSRASRIVETAPLGGLDQPKYLNAVAEVKTSLDAHTLLAHLQKIENALGRVRQGAMSSRTIDLDILLFGQEVINKTLTTEYTESAGGKTEKTGLDSRLRGNDIGGLVVPHPRMHLRSFILGALMELNPNFIHPVLNRSIAELAARLNGRDFVISPDMPQLISIAGIIGVGKTTLARGLAENLKATLLLEAYDTNPFLAKVYAGQKEYALDSQLYFLTSRVEQIGKNVLSGGQIAVTDYIFEKEKIYARRLLDKEQQNLYFKLNATASEKVYPPTVAIYLKETPQTCLDRIHQRNRPYEQRIELDFLQTQYDDYEELVKNWTQCPMITVSMDCRDASQVKKLAEEIKSYIAVKNETY
ncbi:MAG: 2-amino-4-hydroxy-6-hydroxymethyldihydropteridine diphosphokinase [Sedimentisphaerales bacterium]|nr:2-amino-4-hydroxy-6-hydroxymethyldihydropteridine diphosphokinase [Sedimentisphaerales bacterium]